MRVGHTKLSIPLCSNRRDILPAMAQHPRHPDHFVEEFVHPPDIVFIKELATIIEEASDFSEVHVLENHDETELAQDRQKIFDYTRAAKRPGRDAANSHGFVDVL